ncbi:MAG: DNA recombination protein RmuC [Sulfurimonadaceae bacterium]|jgi:DNA recombination protein RmuC|nr:DNA recombination protein RmuC [Sulfurimonadaceae bacterium]
MNNDMIFMGLGALLILGIFYLYLRQKERVRIGENHKEQLLHSLETLKTENHTLLLKIAILETKEENEAKNFQEKLTLLHETKEKLSLEFEQLSNRIFEDKATQFTKNHKTHFENLLQPFREQIEVFANQSKSQHIDEIKERHLLRDELGRLRDMNMQLSQDAHNLTKALKGENKTQGNWGEIILERVLESSGLRKGIEYETQGSLKNDEGKLYRPDVIVHMPQKRDVIIDAKVSLVAYEKYINTDEIELKQQALLEHLVSIKAHLKGLSAKRYEKLEGVQTLDYVLLFMPIEGAFMVAFGEDGTLFERAYEQNIILVSPSTLLVTLRTIEHVWREERKGESARMIVQEAEAIYDKLTLFLDDMQNIEKSLERAHGSYESAMKRLRFGRGNLLSRAHKLKEFGAKPTKEIIVDFDEELT